jgi:hypothetical protein
MSVYNEAQLQGSDYSGMPGVRWLSIFITQFSFFIMWTWTFWSVYLHPTPPQHHKWSTAKIKTHRIFWDILEQSFDHIIIKLSAAFPYLSKNTSNNFHLYWAHKNHQITRIKIGRAHILQTPDIPSEITPLRPCHWRMMTCGLQTWPPGRLTTRAMAMSLWS